jgi:hypothetical protein
MPDATRKSPGAATTFVDQWQARIMQPTFVLGYLAVVFGTLIALAFFVFDSIAGVTSLVVAALGAVVALLPSILTRVEYRLSEEGVEKRRVRQQDPAPFKEIFRFPELDYIVPIRHGFKYYKKMDPAPPLREFLNRHFSDEYSGEVHLEQEDRSRILAHLAERDVRTKGDR